MRHHKLLILALLVTNSTAVFAQELDAITAGVKQDVADEQDTYTPKASTPTNSLPKAEQQPSSDVSIKDSQEKAPQKAAPEKKQVLSKLVAALTSIATHQGNGAFPSKEQSYCKKLRLSFPVADHLDVSTLHQLCNAILIRKQCTFGAGIFRARPAISSRCETES